MADWFKFYCNDLDETRLKYAVNKLPEVIAVWVGILSECCRHKSATIKWSEKEFELFGFSQRLNVSIPKVNEAINLLVEIDYIGKANGLITVYKWGEKQSEYCQSRPRRGIKVEPDLWDVSGQCRDTVGLEERRGEEIRGEEKREPSLPKEATFWNEKCGNLPKVLNCGKSRMKHLANRRRDPFWVANFEKAVAIATQSDFCKGNNDRGWRMSFDFIIERPEAVAKLVEGRYSNHNGSKPAVNLAAARASILSQIEKHPANRQSVYFDSNCDEAKKAELKALRAKLAACDSQMALAIK